MTNQLIKLVERGVSLREAGRRIGVSATTVYRRLLPLGEEVNRRRRKPVTHEDRRRIVTHARNGEVSIRRIAAAVGRSWHTVHRVLASRTDLVRIAVAHRCPDCGHVIIRQPCQICYARSRKSLANSPRA